MRKVLCDGCDQPISPRERETLFVMVYWQSDEGDSRDALDLHTLECLRKWVTGRQNALAHERATAGA